MSAARVFPFLSAADATKALDKTRDLDPNKTAWPYVHLFAPPQSTPVHQIASIVAPAHGAITAVLTYQVPSGFRFILRRILQDFSGGAFLPGDALWTVDRNTPIGIASVQADPVQGLIATPIPLGSIVAGTQWVFDRPYEFEPLDVLRSKVNSVNAGVGAGNWFTSGFFGYLIPALKG